MYNEALNIVIAELKHRFHQTRGIPIAVSIECVLPNAANGVSLKELSKELLMYHNDIKIDRLLIQL